MKNVLETRLIELSIGQICKVVGLDPNADDLLIRRVIQMGLSVGKQIKISHKPFNSSGPIAIELDGHLLGLGQAEASTIFVTKDIL